MKSNDRAMKKWPLFYTHLKNSPTIKTGVLREKLRGQISKTDFYNFLNVYEQKELIIRPTRGAIMLVKKLGFWERRAERKRLEKIEKQLELKRGLRVYYRSRVDTDKYAPKIIKYALEELNEEIEALTKELENATKHRI